MPLLDQYGIQSTPEPELAFYTNNNTGAGRRFWVNNTTGTISMGEAGLSNNYYIYAPLNDSPVTNTLSYQNTESNSPTEMLIEPGGGSGAGVIHANELMNAPYSGFFFGTSGTSTTYAQAFNTLAPICFRLNNTTEACRWDTSGRLLVNTTSVVPGSAGERLQVRSAGSGNLPAAAFYCGGPYNATPSAIVWFSTDAGGSGVLQGNNNTIGLVSVSDVRRKRNVRDLLGSREILDQLRPVRFHWLGQEDIEPSWGFIAHELQAVIPDAVMGHKDAVRDDGEPQHQSLDPGYLVPLLTAVCNELRTELNQLEQDINSYTGAR